MSVQGRLDSDVAEINCTRQASAHVRAPRILPTPPVQRWTTSPSQSTTFLGDLLEGCFEVGWGQATLYERRGGLLTLTMSPFYPA